MQTVVENMSVPKLRFGEFKESWHRKQISDFCKFFSGGTPSSTNREYYNGTIPFIGSGNIFDEEVFSFITKEALNSSSAKMITKGDLLYALYGANSGESAISKLEGAINQAILCIRSEESIEFLNYLLILNKDQIISKYLQGGQGNLSANIVKKLKYYYPSLPEQQKIATFLSLVDEKLQQLNKKKSLLEDYKKGVMQKIFSQELRFKDDNGNNYPDWEEKKLGEVLVEVNQKTTISNEYEILSSTMKGIFKQGDYFKRDIASKDNTGYKILRKNQLVFSPQNLWLGNINLNLTYDIGIVSPSYKIFSFSKDVELSYFKDLLKTPKMLHEYIQASEQGASVVRRNLDMSSFNAIKLNLPCLEEQQKIANFLSAIDEKISLTNIQIDNTKAFKKGLLQQMFV